MSVIYVLIPIAILLTIVGIYLFFWAVKTEQFDDLEKQGMSILYDDDNTTKNDVEKSAIPDNATDESAKQDNKIAAHQPVKKPPHES